MFPFVGYICPAAKYRDEITFYSVSDPIKPHTRDVPSLNIEIEYDTGDVILSTKSTRRNFITPLKQF